MPPMSDLGIPLIHEFGPYSYGDADTILPQVTEDYFPPIFKEYMFNEPLKCSPHQFCDRTFGWVFWSQQDHQTQSTHNPLDNFSFTQTIPTFCVRDKIKLALQKLISSDWCCLNLVDSLLQFWGATKTLEGRTKLITQYQPFALGPSVIAIDRHDLCNYRMGMCREYNNFFYADTGSGEEQLGLLGRVFLHKFPEHTTYVNKYSPEEYPQRDLALRCHIVKSWAVPVFKLSTQTCVGVLEIVSLHWRPSVWLHKSFLGKMCDTFQEFDLGLECFNWYKHYEMKLRDENNKAGKGTGDVTMQLDSPHQPPLDPSNNAHNVVTAEENIIAVTSLDEGKRKTHRERKGTGVRIEVSLDDIRKCAKLKRKKAAEELKVSISTFKRACREYGINRWPPRNIDNVSPFRPSPVVNHGQVPQLNSDLPSNQALASVAHINPRFQDANTVTIKAKYKNNTIKFQLSLLSRFVELHQEVAKRLNLEAETYHVKYKDEEDELILIACDEDLQDCMHSSESQCNISIMVLLEPKEPDTNIMHFGNLFNNRDPSEFEYVDAAVKTRYITDIPEPIRWHISSIADVNSDGNCGFRAVCCCIGKMEDDWRSCRNAMLMDLNKHFELYENVTGEKEGANELQYRLKYSEEIPAPADKWMTMPNMGHIVASTYNVVLVFLSLHQCLTFLPLRSRPPPLRQRKVNLKPHSPMPPIASNWYKYRREEAEGWETPYFDQIADFKRLIGSDVATTESFDVE